MLKCLLAWHCELHRTPQLRATTRDQVRVGRVIHIKDTWYKTRDVFFLFHSKRFIHYFILSALFRQLCTHIWLQESIKDRLELIGSFLLGRLVQEIKTRDSIMYLVHSCVTCGIAITFFWPRSGKREWASSLEPDGKRKFRGQERQGVS